MLEDSCGTTEGFCLLDKLDKVVSGGGFIEERGYTSAEDFSAFYIAMHTRPGGICKVDGAFAVGNDDALVGAFGNDAEVMEHLSDTIMLFGIESICTKGHF